MPCHMPGENEGNIGHETLTGFLPYAKQELHTLAFSNNM